MDANLKIEWMDEKKYENPAENVSKSQKTKNLSKFVYILAKQCWSSFNLTNFFSKQKWDIFMEFSTFHLLESIDEKHEFH